MHSWPGQQGFWNEPQRVVSLEQEENQGASPGPTTGPCGMNGWDKVHCQVWMSEEGSGLFY